MPHVKESSSSSEDTEKSSVFDQPSGEPGSLDSIYEYEIPETCESKLVPQLVDISWFGVEKSLDAHAAAPRVENEETSLNAHAAAPRTEKHDLCDKEEEAFWPGEKRHLTEIQEVVRKGFNRRMRPRGRVIGVEEYLCGLESLQLDDYRAVYDFEAETIGLFNDEVLQPLLLGQDHSYYYFLHRRLYRLPAQSDHLREDEEADESFVMEFKTSPRMVERCDPKKKAVENDPNDVIRYGFSLGVLFYVERNLLGAKKFHSTPWLVMMNALDKSIWAVGYLHDSEEFGELDDEGAVNGSPERLLPINKAYLKPFDVVKLMGPGELFREPARRDFFNWTKYEKKPILVNRLGTSDSSAVSTAMFDKAMMDTAKRYYLDTYAITHTQWRAIYEEHHRQL